MRAPIDDPIIAKVLARQQVAARLFERGVAELGEAMATMERHPDYAKAARAMRRRPHAPARETHTLAWWVHNSIHSVLNDAPVDEAADWIGDDVDPAKTLRLWIETEEREERDRARKQRRRRGPALAAPRATVAA